MRLFFVIKSISQLPIVKIWDAECPQRPLRNLNADADKMYKKLFRRKSTLNRLTKKYVSPYLSLH